MYNTEHAQIMIERLTSEIDQLVIEWRARCERKGKTEEETIASLKRITDKRDRIIAAVEEVDKKIPGAITALDFMAVIGNDADTVEAQSKQLIERI